MLDPVPRRSHRVLSPVSSTVSSAFPKQRLGRLPASVLRLTTSRRPVFRGCRYSLMFRPPSLLTPQIVPTAAILPQGSRGFYVRAYRALLPPHAPDMLTVRIQAIDGTGTFTLSDSQPCRLLTSLPGHYIRFITNTGQSAPGRCIGTFSLVGPPLVPFPFTSPARFSSSVRKPSSGSRLLYTGHRIASR